MPYNFLNSNELSIICLFYTFSNCPKPFIKLLISDGNDVNFSNGTSANKALLNPLIDS